MPPLTSAHALAAAAAKAKAANGKAFAPRKLADIWTALGRFVDAVTAAGRVAVLPGIGKVVPVQGAGPVLVLNEAFCRASGGRAVLAPPPSTASADDVCLTALSKRYGGGTFTRTDAQRGLHALVDALAQAIRMGEAISVPLGSVGAIESGGTRRVCLKSGGSGGRTTPSSAAAEMFANDAMPAPVVPSNDENDSDAALSVIGKTAQRPSLKEGGMLLSEKAAERRRANELAVQRAASTYLRDANERVRAEEERIERDIEERRAATALAAKQAEERALSGRRSRQLDLKRHLEGTIGKPRASPTLTWNDVEYSNAFPSGIPMEAEQFWAAEARARNVETANAQRHQAALQTHKALKGYFGARVNERDELDGLSRDMRLLATTEAEVRREEQERQRFAWDMQVREKRQLEKERLREEL